MQRGAANDGCDAMGEGQPPPDQAASVLCEDPIAALTQLRCLPRCRWRMGNNESGGTVAATVSAGACGATRISRGLIQETTLIEEVWD